MIDTISSFITENNMLSHGDCVICGLSGGADSTFLLLVLCRLREKFGITVEALHINHCLRGDESDRDEAFCKELCKKLDIPFTVVACDVAAYAQEHSLSTEEAARKMRYDAFKRISVGKKIATAHNADDNLETIILNLVRGSALKGLAGIPPVRDNIIRPLLPVTRDCIENFLASEGQRFVTDSSNLSDDYTRNKIRHKIIPLMKQLNCSVVETTVRSASALRDENSLIEELTDSAFQKSRCGNTLYNIADYPDVIIKRCISRLLTDNSLPYSYTRLSDACKLVATGGKLNISGDYYLIADNNNLQLKKIPCKNKHESLSCELRIGDNSIFNGIVLRCELIDCDNLKKFEAVHKKSTYYLLDYDKIIGRAILRNRVFGDKIRLPHRNFESSVKKLINANVPPESRDTLHFIEDESGTVFAENIGIAERVLPDENSHRLLKITVGIK